MFYYSRSENETALVAKHLTFSATPGTIIGLSGQLGSGKTVFVKAFADALGVDVTVTSPSYQYMKTYEIPTAGHRQNIHLLCHIDAYRSLSSDLFQSLGLSDYINNLETVALIEWCENIEYINSSLTTHLFFETIENNRRIITRAQFCQNESSS